MKNFASLIFANNLAKGNETVLADRNGARSMCWNEFRLLVYRVAGYARKHGLKGIVPVCMERSCEAFITLLGLNLAGVGVSPISITTPEKRVRYISGQVGNAVWTAETYSAALDEITDPCTEQWEKEIIDNSAADPDRRDSAYVVFTSGSTGTPKGVLLSNAAVIDSIFRGAGPDCFDFDDRDIVLQTASLSFIAVADECLAPMYAGCPVHVLPEDCRGDVKKITDYIDRFGITKTFMPPQLYRAFEGAKSLRCVCTGSDRIVNLAPKGHRLVGIYGMTEMAGFAFHYEIKKAMDVTPIGVPSTGIREYVVDENGNLSDEGELCVSGSVSHEYFNMPELNRTLITPNPFSNEPGHEFLLHSGDIVRRIPEGGYRYLNRRDNMLKINGQRVEPGEIEIVMAQFDGVGVAAVKGFSDDDGRSVVCGFYTAEKAVDEAALKGFLEQRLPHYMVPALLVKLDAMPLNANGKLDRTALQMPDLSAFAAEYAAPENETQRAICEGFRQALRMECVGIDDDFFRLGGDSIAALTVVKACGFVDLTTLDVIAGKTPRRIAERLACSAEDIYADLQQDAPRARLTDSQMGVYLECMLRPESTMYNIPVHITANRPRNLSDREIAERVDSVLRLHPALYARIENADETVSMVRCAFPKDGICGIADRMPECAAKPFLMDRSPLCRAEVLTEGDTLHIMLDTHHIVSDGTSVNILLRQICMALAGEEPPRERMDPFALCAAESRLAGSSAQQEAKKYFDALLGGAETDCGLLPDMVPAQDNAKPARRYSRMFTTDDISEALRTSDITENTLFMGAFGYALAKMTGQTGSTFAAAENGRRSSLVENTVSMMVRTLPVVVNIDESLSGRTYLKQLQSQFFASMEHDCVSFGDLAREYGVRTDVAFVYQSDMLSKASSGDILAELDVMETGMTFADINASVLKRDGGYELRIEYRTDLYREGTIARFAQIFENAVRNLLTADSMDRIPLISEAEEALLNSFNPAAEAAAEDTVVDVFRRIAAQYPDRTAVVCRDRRYTIAEADRISNCLAAYIHSLGIGREQTVSVLIPRCELIYIATMGVLKSGAVYQPLDPAYPPERVNFMLKDADCRLLIADRALAGIASEYKGKVLYTDEIGGLLTDANNAAGACLESPKPGDTYVLLYTSGTTGTPKGCMLSHTNIRTFGSVHSGTLQVDGSSRIASYASYGFDAHMADLYPAFVNGCEFHIVPDEIRLDFPAIRDFIEANGITHLCMTTQVARQLAMEYGDIKGLKCISCGGEKLASFAPSKNYRFLNLYGPTECTVCVTGFEVDRLYENIPIGKPLGSTAIYIADAAGRRVPVGVPGELIICGPQVGKGYLNRPEQTAKVFVENIYDRTASAAYRRCYRTGDVVRYLEDGNIEYIGRRDLQVKIRGFRIELSEVERVICEYPGITDAVAIAVDIPGGKCIHAYFVASAPVEIAELNRFIRERKPAYMVPAASMQLERFPLTANHKVDKRKLPKIEAKTRTEANCAGRANTALEEKLLAILRDVVGEGSYGADTEFADAGVTSITSIRLATRIFKEYGVHITSKDILDGGSVLSVENTIVSDLLTRSSVPEAAPQKEKLQKYPLTQTQTGIYLDCMRAGMGAYNIPLMFRLPGDVDMDRLKNALTETVAAHPSMLCRIHADANGDAAVYPAPDMEIRVEEETVEVLPPAQTEFAFDESPLFRLRILHCGGEKYLFIEAHHIIADGESLAVFMRDVNAVYCGGKAEKETYTAFDLTLEEQKTRLSDALTEAKEYYDSVFRGISTDYLIVPDARGETRTGTLDYTVDAAPDRVHAFCKKNGVTENVLFTAAFAFTAAKFTAHEDSLFSTIYNGRTDPRTQQMVGMLVKTLPLYLQCAPDTSTADFLHATEKQLRMNKKYDIFSFADAVREYGVSADMIFIYQGRLLASGELDGRVLEQVNVGNAAPKAELSAQVYENDESYRLNLEFNAGHYSAELMESFADAYAACLCGMLSANRLSDVRILSEKAFAKYSVLNDTDQEVPYRPVYRVIESEAAVHPDRVAVIARPESGEGGRERITYGQLDNMANFLAHKLIALGVRPEQPVAIMTGRTKELHLSEYGILKSGGAFLFLSPSYPDDRIEYIIGESGIRVIVTTRRYAAEKADLFARTGLAVVCADEIDVHVKSDSPDLYMEPDSVAYLIYTSGSTGRPKGVMVKQRGILNALTVNPGNIHMMNFRTDVTAAVSAFTFDASVMDTICSLGNGMTVCIASEEEIHDPRAFTEMCLENHVHGILGTPAFMMSLLDYDGFGEVVKNLEVLVAGGEVFAVALYEKLRALNPVMRIINGYGPSETTIACTAKLLTSSENITIGTPLSNYRLYPVDSRNNVLPMGALGELVILGEGVSAGYLNRPDLTQKSFITLMGQRAYKSGDLALITHKGEIEFHGRIDNQVKLNGLRIELGEIESAINGCSGVKNSIVTVNGKDNGKFLTAYYTADRQIPASEIVEKISARLAEYMVPRVLIQLEKMPLTANGKIDKRELPEPAVTVQKTEYEAPRTAVEKELCSAFEKALGLEKVGVNDDFFELGGSSLTATKVAMYALAHNINVAYKDVFRYPTVRQLAALSDTSDAAAANVFDADYTDANAALEGNVWKIGDAAGDRPLGNILLTGATGFLGIHMLKEFLDRETGDVYCLLRAGESVSAELKLTGMYIYYFGTSIEEEIGRRIHCVEGDITDADEVAALKELPFDTLVNCAACVKHFANSDILEKVNVYGVENLVKLCLETGRRLIHVSTVSVAGEGLNGTPDRNKLMRENELYFGQLLENQYIVSKFRAEKLVLEAVKKGLDAKIMRAGNLMPRLSDGEFQINSVTNGFMRRLRGYQALGCIPYSQLSAELEFSPIDETAGAMLALAKTDGRFTVFHANNVHRVFMSDVIRAMGEAGLGVDTVGEDVFAERLGEAMADSMRSNGVSGLIAYLNRDKTADRYMIGYDNGFTANVLNRIGYSWHITDDGYMVSALKQLKMMGFFEFDI